MMKSAESTFANFPISDIEINGLSSRKVAWDVLLSVGSGCYANIALERELSQISLLPGDRGLATEIAYGSIRRRLTLDSWLSCLGRKSACKQAPPLRWLIHLGLYQLLFIERVPSSAAINTTVELAKRYGLAPLAPVVNAILRTAHRVQQSGKPLVIPLNPLARVSAIHSLPEWIVSNFSKSRTQLEVEALGLASNESPTLHLRVNPLLTSRKQVLDSLILQGVQAQPLSSIPQGIKLSGRMGNLQILPGFEVGHWCIQDQAAQWISTLLNVEPGHRVLDVCAAPGGKSTHLAELMGNTGEIWAVDRSKGRLNRVTNNARRLGIDIINTLVADGITLAQKKPEWHYTFDRILIDAPCSGLGTLARHPDARWHLDHKSIKKLLAIQKELLVTLVCFLKPGGRLVYSTCTVNPEENENQITTFLNEKDNWSCLFQQTRWPNPIHGNGFFAAILEP